MAACIIINKAQQCVDYAIANAFDLRYRRCCRGNFGPDFPQITFTGPGGLTLGLASNFFLVSNKTTTISSVIFP